MPIWEVLGRYSNDFRVQKFKADFLKATHFLRIVYNLRAENFLLKNDHLTQYKALSSTEFLNCADYWQEFIYKPVESKYLAHAAKELKEKVNVEQKDRMNTLMRNINRNQSSQPPPPPPPFPNHFRNSNTVQKNTDYHIYENTGFEPLSSENLDIKKKLTELFTLHGQIPATPPSPQTPSSGQYKKNNSNSSITIVSNLESNNVSQLQKNTNTSSPKGITSTPVETNSFKQILRLVFNNTFSINNMCAS